MSTVQMDLTEVLALIEKAIVQKQYDQALAVLKGLRKQIDEYQRPWTGALEASN